MVFFDDIANMSITSSMVMILLDYRSYNTLLFFLLSNNLLYNINTKLQIKSFYGRYVKGVTNL